MKPLETERLNLRKFMRDDFVALYNFLRRPDSSIYSYYWPDSEEGTWAFINESISKAEMSPCYDIQYAAVTKAGNELIGSCNFVLASDSNIGWIVNKDYWNQGYGTEMAKAMLGLGFEEFNLRRIVACCDAENVGSYRIMEKIGMRREGMFLESRRAHKQSLKKYSNEVVYAIDKEEWELQKKMPSGMAKTNAFGLNCGKINNS